MIVRQTVMNLFYVSNIHSSRRQGPTKLHMRPSPLPLSFAVRSIWASPAAETVESSVACFDRVRKRPSDKLCLSDGRAENYVKSNVMLLKFLHFHRHYAVSGKGHVM